jgi:GxxExxY protein
MEHNILSGRVIGAAVEVHRQLGPGLLESAYHDCLKHELTIQGLNFESEVPVPVKYKGCLIGDAYRLDLLVENQLIVELKTVEKVLDLHRAQLLTYLRLSQRSLGLLINFNYTLLKRGVHRVVNNL